MCQLLFPAKGRRARAIGQHQPNTAPRRDSEMNADVSYSGPWALKVIRTDLAPQPCPILNHTSVGILQFWCLDHTLICHPCTLDTRANPDCPEHPASSDQQTVLLTCRVIEHAGATDREWKGQRQLSPKALKLTGQLGRAEVN